MARRLMTATLLGVCLACATPGPPESPWSFFGEMAEDDVFAPGVLVWQGTRLLDEERGRRPEPDVTALAREYRRFQGELRHEIVKRTVRWVQVYSGLYFREDGEIDEWPTLVEVLERGGDDCDGMDVLTFEMLRASGFGRGEIYRAVLVNSETAFHHMVTLWFAPERGQDPYVLDPTGDVTTLVRPLSQIAAVWTPLVLFDETDRFRVRPPG